MSAVQSATAADRALSAFRRLVATVFPGFLYALVHEYAVAESDGLTFSGTPTDPDFSPPLPTGVPYAPSLAGSSCVVPVGTLAYVGFANADPGKPYLVRFAQVTPTSTAVDASGTVTVGASGTAVVLGAPTTPQRFAREGDTYTLGTATGVLTFVSTPQASGSTKGKG